MDKKIYLDCIERIDKHFQKCYEDVVIKTNSKKAEAKMKKQKAVLVRLLILANIDLKNNEVIEGEETRYLPGIKTLVVNPNDSIDYVEKVIVYRIISNMLDNWPLKDFNYNKRLFLVMFVTAGLIKVIGKRALNGPREVVMSNFASLICATMNG